MKNETFTVRLKPFKGEALTSFLIRLANVNGMNLMQLIKMINDSKSHYFQREDKLLLNFNPKSVISCNKLSNLICKEKHLILLCSFYYTLKRFCGNRKTEHSRIMAGMLRESFCYCPLCIKEEKHHKLLWRISKITHCDFHNTKLIEFCRNCNKKIKYKDIIDINRCPYCEHTLCSLSVETVPYKELGEQKWLWDTWEFLVQLTDSYIHPSELAMKILYVINDSDNLDKKKIENTLDDKGKILTLLQHARESLSNSRTLHLDFVLKILFEHNISVQQFFNIQVPESFRGQVRSKKPLKSYTVSCLAPWCQSFGKKGSLTKTVLPLRLQRMGV